MRFFYLLVAVLSVPNTVFANAAIPLVAPTFISAVVLLLPIALIEGYFYRRYFKLKLAKGFWIALKANVYSAVVGVPLVVFSRAILVFLVAYGGSMICQDCQLPKWMEDVLLVLVMAASGVGIPRPPHESDWVDKMLAVLFVFEFIIAYFVSVYWERRTLVKALPTYDKHELTRASYKANTLGYLFLLFAMFIGFGALWLNQ